MTRIEQEASYAEIQDDIKNNKKSDGAEKLVRFSKDHSKSKMAPEALWQAVSLYFSHKTGKKNFAFRSVVGEVQAAVTSTEDITVWVKENVPPRA